MRFTQFRHPFSRALTAALPTLLLVACGGGNGTGPADEAPVIAVTGVSDGATYDEPVTIGITVTPPGATFNATLDGAPFFPGSTVSAPGTHTLVVEARNGTIERTTTIDFEIRFTGESILIIRMFDLGDNDAGGGGDAILLTDSSATGMEHLLVDAGPAGQGGNDDGFVQQRLEDLGVETLEAMVLTHAHTDHYRGMDEILAGTDVEAFVYNGQVRSLSSYESLLTEAQTSADQVVIPEDLTVYELGFTALPTVVTVVPGLPDHLATDTNDGSDLNDGSLGTAVTKGPFRMFMTGDGEDDANQRWRVQFPALSGAVDALKVGHHGANDAVFDPTSSSISTWLPHTDAELQLISSNGTTHPLSRALSALMGQTADTYCTNVHGDIEVRVAPNGTWVVSVEKNAGLNCQPGG